MARPVRDDRPAAPALRSRIQPLRPRDLKRYTATPEAFRVLVAKVYAELLNR